MSERELLIREIAQTPDSLLREVLNFLLFIKARKNQEDFHNPNSENSDIRSLLNCIDRINSEIPAAPILDHPPDPTDNSDRLF